jgi:hypothetical protein
MEADAAPDEWAERFNKAAQEWLMENIHNSPASRNVDVYNHIVAVLPKLGEKLRPQA